MPATSQAALQPSSCLATLDDAVLLYNKGETIAAAAQFELLENSCSHLPQVHHNLGVIAGNEQHWQQAAEHFQRAVADDLRTSMTQSHLRSIHQYKASIAYQNALGVTRAVSLPQLSMQTSIDANPVQPAPVQTTLHDEATIDYELFSWWTAAATNSMQAWLEHYATGYPPLENSDATGISWDEVARNISLTAQDAVVILTYKINKLEKSTLLLLRLQDDRWKIYQETAL